MDAVVESFHVLRPVSLLPLRQPPSRFFTPEIQLRRHLRKLNKGRCRLRSEVLNQISNYLALHEPALSVEEVDLLRAAIWKVVLLALEMVAELAAQHSCLTFLLTIHVG